MKQIVTISILLLLLFLVSCSDRPADSNPQEEFVFSVEAKNKDDRITIQNEQNTTVIDIKSPVGIGGASVTLESGVMPEQIMVRLHLHGLEEFRLISEQLTLIAAIPTSGGFTAQSQRKILGDSEQPMVPIDPLWLKVEIVSSVQDIPLQDGYFEIRIPQAFLEQSGNAFEIQWIDFYR